MSLYRRKMTILRKVSAYSNCTRYKKITNAKLAVLHITKVTAAIMIQFKCNLFQAIEIRKTTHSEVYTEIESKNFHLVYGTPYFLAKYKKTIVIDTKLQKRLERDSISLPEVGVMT